jgi:aspartate ammonia-lyase
MSATRLEKDSLGEVQVPASTLYGVQTYRATQNFPISGRHAYPVFIKAFILIKKAAALAHLELENIDTEIGKNIIAAADEILAGKYIDQFVVDVFQAGAGTSFNMNCNEVLANRALELMGKPRGDYKSISPNDHVNKAQSTNDTFPTAMRVASLLSLKELDAAVGGLAAALREKGAEFMDVIKSGRTHLQDAVPVKLGQEFNAYAASLERALENIRKAAVDCEEMPLGGNALGTGINAPKEYRKNVVNKLSEVTGLNLRLPKDNFEAINSLLPIAILSGALKGLAIELTRIANDLRLLSSGPTTGLAEITLPAVQPGSSIMPGKVNPVMAECLNMVAYQVIGNDTTVTLAAQAGQMDLNVMMPVMILNVLESMDILKNYLPIFTEKCIKGITVDRERCRHYFESSVAMATLLNPYIGYLNAAEVAKEAQKRGVPVPQIIRERKLLTEEQIADILDPDKVTGN